MKWVYGHSLNIGRDIQSASRDIRPHNDQRKMRENDSTSEPLCCVDYGRSWWSLGWRSGTPCLRYRIMKVQWEWVSMR